MKRKYLLYAVLLILFTACTRNSDSLVTPNSSVAAAAGQWKVIFYWDKKDETSNFAGWAISFQADGKLTATKGGTTVNGTWSQTSSRFNLSFGTDPLLSDLAGNWQIISITDSLIKLKDDNPSQDDELHLGK
ncbi:MAG TPA: hypothetical protein VLL95_11620 [Phnomibacter sp.]|nr:hypothetical protein [Phnomibacter sp.]